jgi:hypothetical protein
MAIRMRVGTAVTTALLVGAIGPFAAMGQVPAAPEVSRLVGTWVGDKIANDKAFQDGIISMDFGLKISTASDALVVAQLFKRPPVAPSDPWIQGTTLSYQFEGSLASGTFNQRSVTTRVVKDGAALVLTVAQTPGRAGGAGAGPAAPSPALANVLRTQRMSVDGDRLKVEWSEGRFAYTLFFDREKPRSAQ